MRIVILAARRLGKFEQEVLEPFFSIGEDTIVGCLMDVRPRESLIGRFRKNLRKGRGAYTVIMGLNSLIRKRQPSIDTEVTFAERNIPVIRVADSESPDLTKQVSALNPDILLLINGFGLIREPLLSIAPRGILSFHHGDMRQYRGMPAGFWEIYNSEAAIGLTVQRIGAGLDCGEPIVERQLSILSTDTPRSLRKRALAASTDMMFAAVRKLENEPGYTNQLKQFGTLYTLPNLRSWLIVYMKSGVRRLRGCSK